jgi:hypothetical protein
MGATSLARVTRYLPAGFRRELSRQKLQQYADTNLGDVEFDFLDDCDVGFGSSSSSDEFHHDNHMELDIEDDEDKSTERVKEGCNNEENRNFWDNQLQLLQVINQFIHSLYVLIVFIFS